MNKMRKPAGSATRGHPTRAGNPPVESPQRVVIELLSLPRGQGVRPQVIRSSRDFGAKFRAWDRDFGWIYRTAILAAFLVTLFTAPVWILRAFDSHATMSSRQLRNALFNARAAAPSESAFATTSFPAAGESSDGIAARPLYPYSVIPGGAYSEAELARAIENDPVVARHYADFDVSSTRVERLTRAEAVYVSYRIHDKIYWTQRKITLPAGELVLTDGKHTARTRCGNRLSLTPATPVSQQQPATMAMDTPPNLAPFVTARPASLPPILPPIEFSPIPDTPGSLAPIVGTPESAELVPAPLPPPYFPIIGGGSPPITSIVPPPPVATPEPATLALLLTGLLFTALFYRREARKRPRS